MCLSSDILNDLCYAFNQVTIVHKLGKKEGKKASTFLRLGRLSIALLCRFVECWKSKVSYPHSEAAIDDAIGGTQVAVYNDVRVVYVTHSLQHKTDLIFVARPSAILLFASSLPLSSSW